MASGFITVFAHAVLRPAFAEIIKDGGVIQNSSVSILDPSFGVGIFPRLLDPRHFSDDGHQRTGINVLKKVLPVIIREGCARAHLLICTVPNRDRSDSYRASPVQRVHIHVGLDQMHKRIEAIYALDPKKSVAHGEGPRPSRPAGFQNLFGTSDLL